MPSLSLPAALSLLGLAAADDPGAPLESRVYEAEQALAPLEDVASQQDPDVASQQVPAEAEDVASQQASPVQPAPAPRGSGLRFLGLLQSKAVATSLSTTNPFLDGQVVGVLGGSNGTTVSAEDTALYTEFRGLGFFNYAPPILDGLAELNAAFEVDFLFGDQSYGSGGNVGGGYGADQVNLQTRRLSGSFKPRLGGGHSLTVVAGLQFVADGVSDPAAAKPDDLFRAGGKLIFFGSEAAGLTAYGRYKKGLWEHARYRLGAYTLWEDATTAPDDVTLFLADGAWHPTFALWAGLHAWYLRDRAGGAAGGLLGAGPGTGLAVLQGATNPDLSGPDGTTPPVDADLIWLGLDVGRNHDLSRGPVGVSALAVANLGRLYVEELEDASVRGLLLDAELRGRYAPGAGSVGRVELLWSSADDPDTRDLESVVTGNDYGYVGAVYASHGCFLLFPDPGGIDRQVAVVYGPAALGAGVLGVTGSLGYDLVPNRLTATAGGGLATTAAGEPVGEELNLRLRGKPWLFANLELGGAVVLGTEQPATPWLAQLAFDWLAF